MEAAGYEVARLDSFHTNDGDVQHARATLATPGLPRTWLLKRVARCIATDDWAAVAEEMKAWCARARDGRTTESSHRYLVQRCGETAEELLTPVPKLPC